MPSPLQFDMVFLDHLKPLYTIDLKVMEEEGLIGPVRTFPLDLPRSPSPIPPFPHFNHLSSKLRTNLVDPRVPG